MPFHEPVNFASIISETSIVPSAFTVTRSSKCWMTSSRALAGATARRTATNRKKKTAPNRRRFRDDGIVSMDARWLRRGAETDFRDFALGRGADFEKFARLETEHAGENI